eukprot:4435200-Prymnesium_polylepis.1
MLSSSTTFLTSEASGSAISKSWSFLRERDARHTAHGARGSAAVGWRPGGSPRSTRRGCETVRAL